MDNSQDFTSEYLALKAANDQLRVRGVQWLWESLELLSAGVNRELVSQVQIGRQEWQFKVENSVMVGERFGLRHGHLTLTVEAGWPREPQHGFVPDGGLARGRIGLSRNIMLDAQIIAELILKRQGRSEPVWRLISNNKLGEPVTESHLRRYLEMILSQQ